MKFFDRIEQCEVNGLHELFAVDEQKNERYLLRKIITESESSVLSGNWLVVNSIKKRVPFENEKSMNEFCKNLVKLANELDAKNNS